MGARDHAEAFRAWQVNQQREPGGALDERADGGTFKADQQVAFRKTVDGPGGSGVAEVALRSGR
jgi:hypothetical protein